MADPLNTTFYDHFHNGEPGELADIADEIIREAERFTDQIHDKALTFERRAAAKRLTLCLSQARRECGIIRMGD